MAFASKLGTMLKQTVSKHINMELSASTPSLYQAIRCMSSSKLYVGGLPYATDEMGLREVFAQYGEVVEARIVMDRDTGRSRGFGFVNYTSSDEASSAIQALDGKDFQGRWLKVNYAVDKPRAGGFGGDPGYGYTAGSGSYGASGGYGSDTHGSSGNSYSSGEGSYIGGSGYGGGNYGSGNGNDGFGSGNYSGRSSFDGGNSSGYGGGSISGNHTVASAGNAGGDNYFGGSSSGDSGYAGSTGTSFEAEAGKE